MSYIDESDLQISANRAVAHVKREVLTCRDLVFANGLDDDALCYTHVVAYPRMLVERPSGVRFLFGFAIGLEINHVQASQQSVAKLCHLTNHFAISEIHPLLARGIGVTKPNPE